MVFLRRRERGFTLIQVILVVIIIGIIAIFAVPRLLVLREATREHHIKRAEDSEVAVDAFEAAHDSDPHAYEATAEQPEQKESLDTDITHGVTAEAEAETRI